MGVGARPAVSYRPDVPPCRDVTEPVNVTIDDGVAVVRIDDGKANAVSHAVIDALHGALDQATADADRRRHHRPGGQVLGRASTSRS